MSNFSCPVCGEKLNTDINRLFCKNGHSFDLAKSGYVNLLLSQQPREKRHGDDKLMVRCRRDFLNKGYYNVLLDALLETVKKYAPMDGTILDAGCGECFYTAVVFETLLRCGLSPRMLGVDISKDALAAGAKRCAGLELAAASVFRLPVQAASCHIVLSVFAPLAADEFRRVLKDNGVMIRVVPLEKHLLGLKAVVYDSAYENPPEDTRFEGFELIEKREIRGMIHLGSNEDIQNVFTMTPYYYKTGAKDQEKLKALTALDTQIEFGIAAYRKT